MKPKKPSTVVVEPLRARAIRPPTARLPHWYWRVEVHCDGQTRTVWSGRGARQEINALLVQMVSDGSWEAEIDGEEGQVVQTVSHLLRAWLYAQEQRGDLRPKTLSAYRQQKKRVEDRVGDVLVAAVDRRLVETYRDDRFRMGNASTTIAQDLAVWSMAWRWGLQRGVTTRELPKVKVKVVPTREKITPRPEERDAVLRLAEGYAQGVLQVMALTGCRVGEASGIRAQDVDLDAGWLTLRGKTGARKVPVSEALRQVLELWLVRGKGGTTIWGVGLDAARMRVIQQLPRLCRRAGVRVFTSHGLRRSVVQAFARSGVDIKTAAEWLGHSPEVMLAAYRQVSEEDLQKAMRQVADRLPSLEVAGADPETPEGVSDVDAVRYNPHDGPAQFGDSEGLPWV